MTKLTLDYSTHDTAIYIGDSDAHCHFNSVDAFVNYAGRKSYTSTFNKNDEWSYYASGSDMAEFIDTRTMPKSIMNRLNTELQLDVDGLTIETNQPLVQYDESGIMIDWAAHYAGEDECMINVIDTPMNSKTIWLASSIISGGGVKASNMINRGVALIRAVKTLQASGYSVGLIAYFYGNGDKNILCDVVVKRPDEPLNETLVAAALCHPSFFRTLGHNLQARIERLSGMSNRNHDVTPELFKYGFANINDLTILNGDFHYSDCRTPEDAEQWIQSEVSKALEQREQREAA